MENMHLLITKSGKFLDIFLILWRISPAIQHVPLNEQNGDSNQLSGRIVYWSQRVFPVVLSKILENASQVRSKGHQTVVLTPETATNMQNTVNMVNMYNTR